MAASPPSSTPVVPGKAFESSSTESDVALEFLLMNQMPGKVPVLMEFDAGHSGRRLTSSSAYANEAEVLMPPAKQAVVKRSLDMVTHRVIQLESVPAAT